MSIAQNLVAVKKKIGDSVQLIAVSKTKPVSTVLEAYEAGQRIFGENYVQELVDKYEALPKDIEWHFIGHLQSNKVKYIAPFVSLIQGVDSLNLLTEINKQALKNNRVINCLLQVYIAKEETKFGLSYEEFDALLNDEAFIQLNNIKICGMMAMATNTDDTTQIEREFTELNSFFKMMKITNHQTNINLQILSIGMSSDYKIAIECGATHVRLGSVIFGSRNYNK